MSIWSCEACLFLTETSRSGGLGAVEGKAMEVELFNEGVHYAHLVVLCHEVVETLGSKVGFPMPHGVPDLPFDGESLPDWGSLCASSCVRSASASFSSVTSAKPSSGSR